MWRRQIFFRECEEKGRTNLIQHITPVAGDKKFPVDVAMLQKAK